MATPAARLALILAVFMIVAVSVSVAAILQIGGLTDRLTIAVVLADVVGFGGLILVELYSFLCNSLPPRYSSTRVLGNT